MQHHVAPHRRCRFCVHVSRETHDVTPCHLTAGGCTWLILSHASRKMHGRSLMRGWRNTVGNLIEFVWLKQAYRRPHAIGTGVKHRGVRFHRIRDVKQYYYKPLSLSLSIHVYIYIYIYIHIHTYIHIHIYIYIRFRQYSADPSTDLHFCKGGCRNPRLYYPEDFRRFL